MKKTKVIFVSILILLVFILFCPFSVRRYDDGGTREYIALTYKVVKWNHEFSVENSDGKGGNVLIYDKTSIYWSPDNFKSIGELWEIEYQPTVGQSVFKGKDTLLTEGNISSILVKSLPEGIEYSFSGDDAMAIVDYLSCLTLFPEFEENPDEYGGMTWNITLEYDNGETISIYHFVNMFIRTEDGPWYKMVPDEAHYFDELLNKINI